jgi:hypothetical protein
MPPLFICESEFARQVLFVNEDIMSGDINGAGNNWDLANIALDDIVIANSNCNGKYRSYRYTIYMCFYILM